MTLCDFSALKPINIRIHLASLHTFPFSNYVIRSISVLWSVPWFSWVLLMTVWWWCGKKWNADHFKGLNMYINLNFICNNEMRPFTLMSLHFNHLEMKTMNSFKSAFEPFSSEYCWGNCLDQCHAGSAKAAIGKFIQSHRNQDKISWWLSDCNGEKYELGDYELIQF